MIKRCDPSLHLPDVEVRGGTVHFLARHPLALEIVVTFPYILPDFTTRYFSRTLQYKTKINFRDQNSKQRTDSKETRRRRVERLPNKSLSILVEVWY